MSLEKIFTATVLVALVCLAASCGTHIAETSGATSTSTGSSGGGGGGGGGGGTGGGQEGPPKTWCSKTYGTIRSANDGVGAGDVLSCPSGDICANAGDQGYDCCDLKQVPTCASNGYGGGQQDNVYCAPWGWQRLPMVTGGSGAICASNEICAGHKTTDCKHICCDPRMDPDCGVALLSCCGQCG